MEILTTPGRITLLGEGDGNRLRRIYTDGRKMPDDPDVTAFGYSVGHWEGQTLVVETTGVWPQAYVLISEGVGVPNDGGMRVLEHIHLTARDTLVDDLEITAPKVLSAPWKTTRIWRRLRGEKYEIAEGECVQEQVKPAKDKAGHDVFVLIPPAADGSIVPSSK
jgi:hypothetical protein